MNARRLATVFFMAVVFLPAGERLSSQQPPPAAPAQGQGRNPLTTAEHLRLAFLVGRWEEQVAYTSAKPEEPKQPQHPCPCCGGLMIIIETFKRGQQPTYRPPPRSAFRIDSS